MDPRSDQAQHDTSSRSLSSPASPPDPIDEFFRSLNEADIERLSRCLHPGFELVVPQKPGRGFKGRDREVHNMQSLFESYGDLSVRVLRRVDDGDEVWTETETTATGLEMAAVIIWTIDRATGTLVNGRYYSDVVQPDAPPMEEFIRTLAARADGGPTEATSSTP